MEKTGVLGTEPQPFKTLSHPKVVKRVCQNAAFQAGADYLCILTLPLAATLFTPSFEINAQKTLLFWNVLATMAVLLAASNNGYRRARLNQAGHGARLIIRYFLATGIAMLAAAFLLGHPHAINRLWTTLELTVTPLLFIFTRHILQKKWHGTERQMPDGPLLVCYDHVLPDLPEALLRQNVPGTISGVLYLSGSYAKAAPDWPMIAGAPELLTMLRNRPIQDVVFVHQPEHDAASSNHKALLAELLAYPVNIWLAFDLAPQMPSRHASRAGAYKLMPLLTDRLVNSLNPAKRVFDFALSLILLCLLSPLFAVIALLVRASGPGPVVFRQSRTGAHGRRFTVLKFRTMRHKPAAAVRQAVHGDSRITPIGRFLRRSSLDELLQLINVLRGEMSLVGPRPHAPDTLIEDMSFDDIIRRHQLRYRVKPGMTGLAQIRGQRGETKKQEALEQRIESDLEYIQTWSVWLDILILLRTVPVVLKRQNAY